MSKILVKDKDIVIPGDVLAEGMEYLPSGRAYRDKDKLFASSLGLVNIKGRVIKVIPLAGRYIPKEKDLVVGRIEATGKYGWHVDINAPNLADLNVMDATMSYVNKKNIKLSKFFQIGDLILAGISEVSETGYTTLTMKNRMYRKLLGGVRIAVSPTKIPRIIGKQGSMIRTLKDISKCDIMVGQNGIVWMRGEPEMIVKLSKAIKLIESQSHTSGLTDRVTKMIGGGR